MNHVEFEWDEKKNKSNIKKHGISFDEAKTVFFDENAMQFYDENHSDSEERFIMLGFSNHARMLIVCHCVKDNDSLIRIISARKATKNESKYYGDQNER